VARHGKAWLGKAKRDQVKQVVAREGKALLGKRSRV
jgi:hypothetical protein